ncbi:MAG: HD domain-containing protein, partial [Anaerovorax sp.]
DEIKDCQAAGEYKRFIKLCNDNYIYEFMRIGAEITPYNTLGHISGVHFVAMHVARQLAKTGSPVDIALVSASAAAHDVGKYFEAARIPYLHYYYTDQCLREYGMSLIAHIASNHSTWDLELENLSAEALILIYADFRVKSGRDQRGREIVNFYTLEQSFQVILGKLDNLDAAKTLRYNRVYAKLKDFEEYMISLGVNTDLKSSGMTTTFREDPALQSASGVVSNLKYLAIEHNLNLMSRFNSEASFGSLLEAARSEKQWKSIRAYVNIFDEYSTYMTQKQKLMLLHFLYELLMHREGDIRRQAAALMGSVLAGYDEEYRKELPVGAVRREEETNSLELWDKYLENIIFPDHRVVEQHKRWLGYTLKIVLNSILTNCKAEEQGKYIGVLMDYFEDTEIDDSTAFILLDSMLFIPLDMCGNQEMDTLLRFADAMSQRQPAEVKIAVLRFIKYVSEFSGKALTEKFRRQAKKICGDMEDGDGIVSIVFLKYKIMKTLNASGNSWRILEKKLCEDSKAISDIFLENLKVGTPWVIKAVNIELLLDRLGRDTKEEILHVATHLANLLKVSERVTVRHTAGAGLLAVASRLPLDQRNEVVIELTKGLEIGEYQFSKYIPEYLGELALYLHPNELDEVVWELRKMLDSNNEKV